MGCPQLQLANGHGILKYSLSPLENGAVVEDTRDGGRSALAIDNYACAALVCLCRDPPIAQTGALCLANPLLALLTADQLLGAHPTALSSTSDADGRYHIVADPE